MQEFRGKLNGEGLRIAIVVSRFNELVTNSLLKGAIDTLRSLNVQDSALSVIWVPGAFEIPLIAKILAESDEHDAIICLGAIIRGSTPHFDYVASCTANGIAKVSHDHRVPVIFGVLTTDTTDQAFERAGIKGGNKGSDAAFAAVEMANLILQLQKESVPGTL